MSNSDVLDLYNECLSIVEQTTDDRTADRALLLHVDFCKWQTKTSRATAPPSSAARGSGYDGMAACRLAPSAGFTQLRLCLVGEPHRDGPIRLRMPPMRSRPRHAEIGVPT
jgi:hypothetical protein